MSEKQQRGCPAIQSLSHNQIFSKIRVLFYDIKPYSVFFLLRFWIVRQPLQSGVAWMRLSGATPAYHLAPHHAPFSAMQVQAAIDFAECGCGREVAELECKSTPRSTAHRTPPRTFFCKCILQAAIDFAEVHILAMRGRRCTYTLTFSWLSVFKKIEKLIYPYNICS